MPYISKMLLSGDQGCGGGVRIYNNNNNINYY